MKNEFEKIERGLKLIKEEGEKNIKDISFVDKFLNSIEKERIVFIPLKLKYSFISLIAFLILSNLFFINKSNFDKKNIVVLNDKKMEKQLAVVEKEESFKEEKVEIKNLEKLVVENKLTKNDIKENNDEKEEIFQPLGLEQTIKFTEEINKILGLFTINLNIEINNVES